MLDTDYIKMNKKDAKNAYSDIKQTPDVSDKCDGDKKFGDRQTDNQSDCLHPKLLGRHSTLARSLRSVVESYQSYEDLPNTADPISTDTNDMKTIPDHPTEKGRDAMVVLACSTLLAVLLDTTWIAFPVFYVEFSEHFNESKFLTGGIGSVQNALCQTLQMVSSGLVQVYGCKPVAVVGALLVSLSFVLSAFAPSIGYLYITYGVIGGIGQSLLNLPNAVIIQQHFHKHRSLATSVMMMGGGVGLIIGPLVIRYLISTFFWKGALMIYGAISLHSLPLVLFFKTPKAYRSNSGTRFRDTVRKIFNFELLRHRIFVAFCICIFLLKFNTFGFYHHLPNRMVFYGYNKDLAALFLTIAASCALTGRLVAGVLGNFKCTNSSVFYGVSVVIAGASNIAIGFTYSYVASAILSGIYGFFHGTIFLVLNLVLVHHFGVERFARCRGLMNLFNGSAGLLATPFAGWLFDVTGNYNIPFIVTGSIGISGGLIFLSTLLIHSRKR